MYRIREMEWNGVDSASIYNMQFHDERLRKDIVSFEEGEGISLDITDLHDLSQFDLLIRPLSGYYINKTYRFHVTVPEFFPFQPYKVKLVDPIFHPNIDEEGRVCLNLIREDWVPSIDLSQVACSLQFLLSEPNPDDPLNEEAATLLKEDPETFR
ncbi:hypothetical protein WA588_000121, partial [Blastocystis sp. NMH]